MTEQDLIVYKDIQEDGWDIEKKAEGIGFCGGKTVPVVTINLTELAQKVYKKNTRVVSRWDEDISQFYDEEYLAATALSAFLQAIREAGK